MTNTTKARAEVQQMRKLKLTFKKGNYQIVGEIKLLLFHLLSFQVVKIEVL